MIRWFKWCMGAVIAVLVVWWLNIPFLDSQRDDAPLIVTSTPITQHLVETIMGPDVQIVSLVDRLKDPARQTISVDKLAKLSNADVLIINGGGLEASYGDLSPYIKKTTRVINLHDLMTTYEKRWPTHYWMNPVSWNKLVYYLQIRLKAIFPKNESQKLITENKHTIKKFISYTKPFESPWPQPVAKPPLPPTMHHLSRLPKRLALNA